MEDVLRTIEVVVLTLTFLGFFIFGVLQYCSLNNQKNLMEIQTDLMKNQTFLFERSSPPYEPWIKIVPDERYLDISAEDITNGLGVINNWNPNYLGEGIGLTIYNFGQMDSQRISCAIENDDPNFHIFMSYKKNLTNVIENIPAGVSDKFTLRIFEENCLNDPFKCDMPWNVSLGNHTLMLDCRCDGCFEQNSFNKIINYCVYYKNQSEECPQYN